MTTLLDASLSFADPFRIRCGSKELEGLGVQLVHGSAHYAQSPEKVWELLNQIPQFPTFIPKLKEAESHGMRQGAEHIYVSIDTPWLPDFTNLVAVTREKETRTFRWALIEGKLKSNEGKLSITKEGTGSLVYVEVRADAGRIIPAEAVTWSVKRYLPLVLRAIGKKLIADQQKATIPKPTQAAK